MPRIAFIGAGRMASAMVDGLLARKTVSAAQLCCLGAGDSTARALSARTGIGCARDLPELVAGADAVVVAFKPQNLASADPALAGLTEGKLVLSILAGKRIATLSRVFPRARALVRCMPNTPARIGAGVTAWCAASAPSPGDRSLVDSILGSMGAALEVSEDLMDAVTGLSGSGPAYVFEFAAALRDGGVAAGLAPEAAQRLAIETLLGAARLLAREGVSPEVLRDQVTSPNGTTLAGLRRLEAGGFRGLIRETVLAAAARSAELSREGA
jgi:pyrroline-5-carboxylate reductase